MNIKTEVSKCTRLFSCAGERNLRALVTDNYAPKPHRLSGRPRSLGRSGQQTSRVSGHNPHAGPGPDTAARRERVFPNASPWHEHGETPRTARANSVEPELRAPTSTHPQLNSATTGPRRFDPVRARSKASSSVDRRPA